MTWVSLYEHHPDLFFKAKSFEDKRNENTDFKKVGWNLDMMLDEMIKPDNIIKIKANYEKIQIKKSSKNMNLKPRKLINLLVDVPLFVETEENENGCLFCHL